MSKTFPINVFTKMPDNAEGTCHGCCLHDANGDCYIDAFSGDIRNICIVGVGNRWGADTDKAIAVLVALRLGVYKDA